MAAYVWKVLDVSATGDNLPTGGQKLIDNWAVVAGAFTIDSGSFDVTDVTITGGTISGITDLALTDGGTGASTAAGARTNLGVDAAGTDNSTNVTLSGTGTYLTLAGQDITVDPIDLTTDVTGVAPLANGGTGTSTLTAGEIAQIENIGLTTISATQWGYVGAFNQGLTTTSNVTFAALSISSMATDWTNAGRTVADMGVLSTVDINGGSVDGAVIGGSLAAAGAFTDLSSSNTADFSTAGVYLGGAVAANLLDDYEEGTFTPALTAGTSGTITLNGAIQDMSYTKIGNTVHVRGFIRVGSVSSPTGALRLTGLPFVMSNFPDQSERPGFYVSADTLASAVNVLQGDVVAGANEVRILGFDGTNTLDTVADKIQASTDLIFGFSYPAA